MFLSGIVMQCGEIWNDARRFTLCMMKEFGMGKAAAEDIICHESTQVMEMFASYENRAFNPLYAVSIAVSNIICSFVFGRRFDYEDPKFKRSLLSINNFAVTLSKPLTVLPLRTRLGRWIFKKKHEELQKHFRVFGEFVEREIAEHKQRYNGTVNDLIDGFLLEMETNTHSPSFTGE